MPKRFNFRFSGVLPAFCRPSKHSPSDLPSDPFLSFLHHVSRLRLPPATSTSTSNWTKSHNWHILDADLALPRRKIYNSAASSDEEQNSHIVSLPPPRGKRRSRLPNKSKKPVRLSVSSSDSGLFSDVEHEIMETLVSNSTDSSIRRRKTKKRRGMKKVKIGGRRSLGEDSDYAAARLSVVFSRLVPCTAAVEGKVRESLAVVKRSEKPYEDFKKSMVEMIVEKKMVEENDLQELLRCLLSLNSEQHHGSIIRAFQDIVMSESVVKLVV